MIVTAYILRCDECRYAMELRDDEYRWAHRHDLRCPRCNARDFRIVHQRTFEDPRGTGASPVIGAQP